MIKNKLHANLDLADDANMGKTKVLFKKKKDDLKTGKIITIKKTKKEILTPFKRMKKRILKEFSKKKLIGDIIINEVEYEMLIEYFKMKCDELRRSYSHSTNDPIFATALVQIGIKKYDGNLWTHVAQIIGVAKLSAMYQGWIGESFVNTLLLNNKILISKSERVNNILMHGFVSDYYADEMFNFFFKYYNIDLERDLQRNSTEMMKGLFDVTQRNDNTGRTYLLVKQTANSIWANARGGKSRIRRILRLIDKCFWEQITPANPVSRISILFNSWQENSSEFKMQFNNYNGGVISGGGKKSYSSPYIKCDFFKTEFKLVLPTQLIKFEYKKDVRWIIYSKGQQRCIDTSLSQGVTGYKTEAEQISISSEYIFNEFIIELICGDKRIKLFKIKTDSIRFFDKEGDYLNSDNSLPSGEVYSFTRENETPRSEALIENEPIGKLVRSFFGFEYGDIVRLPDGKPISIGKKLEEGLLHRKSLSASQSINNEIAMPIYSAAPTILLKIAAKRANGTMIEINGNKYRLFDKETTVIELGDRSGETGYVINLSDYDCIKNGIYTINVNVPNDRTNRFWQYVLINGISYEFEDAPYIFKSKGTIRFNEGLDVYSKESKVMKNSDENSFNFATEPDVDDLQFTIKAEGEIINLSFNIPVLKWKFNEGLWNIEKPSDIWHSDFPAKIYFKYPEDKIKLSMEEQIDDYNISGDQTVFFDKSKAKEIFECDMTRFKSWFGREKVARSVFIDLPKHRTEFARVITRSVVVSHILKYDFESQNIVGELNIIGKANYYVDVILLETNSILVEKMPVSVGKFEVSANMGSGLYKVIVFEDEEDDTGFEVSNYWPIYEFNQEIINSYNLQGKSIEIKSIRKDESSLFQMQLVPTYIICGLKQENNDNKHNYKGRLLIKTKNGYDHITDDVNVEFYDLNKLQYAYITYYDGYDFVEFLHDLNLNSIVKEEEVGLKRAVRYRRYDSIYPEDYTYVVTFTNDLPGGDEIHYPGIKKLVVNQTTTKQHYKTIENMNLSVRTYYCLRRAGIKNTVDIMLAGAEKLIKVRNLGKEDMQEIALKMQGLGYIFK